jgi:signal transduction histidine kinase
MEAGQLTLTLDDYAIDDLVSTVLVQVEPLAREKKLALESTLPPSLPVARGDQQRIAQVLLNLVSNAIKFTEVGGVAVQVETADDELVVAVSDTGVGIDASDQGKIFEEFQQAEALATRPKGGTGLGLSIAKHIIELHGGSIWVDSVPGEGSTFSFRVPVRVERQVGT